MTNRGYDTMGSMSEWYVRLEGRKCDLQELSKLFSLPNPIVCEEHGEYILKSRMFSELEDSNEVFDMATHILELVHGVAKLILGDFEAVRADAVWRFDEEGHKRVAMIFSETIAMTARASMTTTAVTANGPIDSEQSSSESNSWLGAALRHNDMAKALLFMREPNWYNLFKVYEVIRDAIGGKREILKSGWVTKQELSLFCQTAQSWEAVGDAARHAAKKYITPKDPMSLSRATSLITGLLCNWIESCIQQEARTPKPMNE